MDPDAADWGLRAAYNLPQKLDKKPEPMMIQCPFCNNLNNCSNLTNTNCNGAISHDMCWPMGAKILARYFL